MCNRSEPKYCLWSYLKGCVCVCVCVCTCVYFCFQTNYYTLKPRKGWWFLKLYLRPDWINFCCVALVIRTDPALKSLMFFVWTTKTLSILSAPYWYAQMASCPWVMVPSNYWSQVINATKKRGLSYYIFAKNGKKKNHCINYL